MAAVIDLHIGEQLAPPAPRPRLRLVQGGARPGSASAPAARLAVARPVSERTYLVRRVLVAAVVVLAVVLAAQALAGIGRGVASALDTAPEASGQVHVVAPGETAWELAARYAPSMDRRVAVDELLALNGQGSLRIGQELRLPASFD